MTQSNSNNSQINAAKGYWIVLAEINEPSRFGQYTSVAGPLIVSFGGRVLARGDVTVVVEGAVTGREGLSGPKEASGGVAEAKASLAGFPAH